MNDFATAVSEMTQHTTTKEQQRPLRQCVEDAIQAYFTQIGGHPVGDLYQMVLQEVEHPLLDVVMKHVGGNQCKASELLGINRGTLRKKLKHYGLHE